MNPDASKRPIVVLLTSSFISMLGVAFATTAGFSWLFVLPMRASGQMANPYIGLVIVLAIPALLLLGLMLIPIGIAHAAWRIRAGLIRVPDRRAAWRKLGIFFGAMSFVNLLIGSQATYRAVHYMDTKTFCGQTCHVMRPEFTAWSHSPHSKVECVNCHIAPGAKGYIRAKMNGVEQLIQVVRNSYPRPIPPGLATDKLAPSAETCENCHSRDQEMGTVVVIKTTFNSDERNTRAETVLAMPVGGANAGGIHGAHLGHGARIRYAVADMGRQTIPWVEYSDNTGRKITWVSTGITAGSVSKMPKFEMECADCHNRAGHPFESPDGAVDRAMATGSLPVTLPWLKKKAVELLSASYRDSAEADAAIGATLPLYYRGRYPGIYEKDRASIDTAVKMLRGIYNRNIFSDLRIGWGTYSNHLGHMESPGCFRCHDGDHVSARTQAAIPNDCSVCHRIPAVGEAAPPVLKALGLSD